MLDEDAEPLKKANPRTTKKKMSHIRRDIDFPWDACPVYRRKTSCAHSMCLQEGARPGARFEARGKKGLENYQHIFCQDREAVNLLITVIPLPRQKKYHHKKEAVAPSWTGSLSGEPHCT